ncbi:MAG: M81 family metallopeptidase [Chloroflexota bacterium]
MRLAIGGIAHESCTFSPLPMRLTEFTVLRGAALLARYPFLEGSWPTERDTSSPRLRASALKNVTAVPLLWAKGLPGGPVPAAVYHQLKTELLAGLETQGPWDGVYLDLHGALFVQGRQDAEADLIRAVRQVVGPDCPIAASYDLHGNLSAAVVDQLDLLTAYRTAPHTDELATRERAFRLLVQMIERGQRPFKIHLPLPLLLPGEQAMSTVEPGASLYQQVTHAAQTPGVWDASLLVGYAWADEPRVGSSVVVFGEDETAVTHTAHELATAVWQARHDFRFGMPTGSIDDCISQALAAPEPTVFISDAGDNPTGGGVGDVTAVLARLLERRVPEALFASLVDKTAVAHCFAAGVGAEVSLLVGGQLDRVHGKALAVNGRVQRLHDGDNRQVVLQIGGVTLILTSQRTAFTTLAQFTDLGLNPLDYKMVVVKLGYLFPELQTIAPLSLLAFSPGAINPDVCQLPYTQLKRPIFPLDPTTTWEVDVMRDA